MLKHVARAVRKLGWETRPKMFKEFQPSDTSFPIALALYRVNTEADKLRRGVKIVFSENGDEPNDIYSYIWRLICSNGLTSRPEEATGRLLQTRKLKMNAYRAIRDGLREAMQAAERLGDASLSLSRHRVRRVKGEEMSERLRSVVERLGPQIGLPKNTQEIVTALWASQDDRTLYGLQNAITTLARQERNEQRASLERVAGRLVFQSDRRLSSAVSK
jgi:hypothetical protein